MKPISLLIRRAHLYVAMICLPWIIMYGVSSLAFSHPSWFPMAPSLYDTSGEEWTRVGSWVAEIPVPDGEAPREVAAELMVVAGVESDVFATFRTGPQTIQVEVPSFWTNTRLTYHLDQRRVELHTSRKRAHQILSDMHATAGYTPESLPHTGWAVMVDLVAVGFLLWIASGLYMWWKLKRMRYWGAIALGAGLASFCGFILLL